MFRILHRSLFLHCTWELCYSGQFLLVFPTIMFPVCLCLLIAHHKQPFLIRLCIWLYQDSLCVMFYHYAGKNLQNLNSRVVELKANQSKTKWQKYNREKSSTLNMVVPFGVSPWRHHPILALTTLKWRFPPCPPHTECPGHSTCSS